ncbi:MAG: polyprenyl synthetase family protein [Anaerolineae bacterium]|nr:polyprenyl synthetase family protein [Anaerolineae bacterium]
MDLESYTARYLPSIEQEMVRVFDYLPAGPEAYGMMLRYHLGWTDPEGPRGKRARPLLLLLCALAAGGEAAAMDAMPAAAAVELLHNFSLIHDDIQDASKTRRGRPTVWTIWGTAQAINAGDAMYALAHRAMHRLAERGVDAGRVLEAYRLFTDTCLVLTLGQHMDLDFEERSSASMDEYMTMIGAKSAALIAASAEIGAVVGGADGKTRAHYAEFGRSLGLAFQIRDDILGIWGDEAVTGKSARSDIVARKKSLPVIYALERSQALRDLYAEPAFTEEQVDQAVMRVEETGARVYAETQESRAHGAALTALRAANPAPEPAAALTELAARLLKRER